MKKKRSSPTRLYLPARTHHFNGSFASDEGSCEKCIQRFRYRTLSPDLFHGHSYQEYFRKEKRNETKWIGLFAHKDYLKYMAKPFLINIQGCGHGYPVRA